MSLVLAQDVASNDMYLWWGFILLGAAIVLLAIELFVPSGGLIGMLCGIAAISSIICFWRYDTWWGAVAAGAYVVLTPICLVFVFKLWLNSPIGKGMILGGDSEPVVASSDDAYAASEQARVERLAELTALIGTEGMTLTELRPVGTVRIDGRRIDALAEGGTIPANTPVVVTDVYDNQIKVRPL